MANEGPGRTLVANLSLDETAKRTAEFWKFYDEWDYRVLAAILIVVAGAAVFAISSFFVLPALLWIPPALIVASSPVVFVLSRRLLQRRGGDGVPTRRSSGSASIVYSSTVVAEVLQFVSLPCIVYWLWKCASTDASGMESAGVTGWWMAAYGTMQMAKRVGLSTLTIAMFSAQAATIEALQERIAQLEKRS